MGILGGEGTVSFNDVYFDHFILKLQFDFIFSPIFMADKCLLRKEQALWIVVVRGWGGVGTFHINIPYVSINKLNFPRI